MTYTTRPLSDRTWLRPANKREGSRFDSTWTKTLQLLEREVGHLRGRDLVIEVDVSESDLKLDGTLRARAQAASPAVVVAFETKALGPMLYRCDRFTAKWREQGEDWQQNIRAVALTLEALRSVDRYGATETGQQYTGFKALPAGRAMPASHMTRSEALSILKSTSQLGADDGKTDLWPLTAHWSKARARAHPDRNAGDRALWDQVEQAAQVLGLDR